MPRSRAEITREIIGLPTLPPAKLGGPALRARGWLVRALASTVPPPVAILDEVFGILDHQVLRVLCLAGVPDALDGPTRPEVLAEELGADPVRLERFLRFAVTRGWLRMGRDGRVRPTRFSEFLRRDHPGGWRAWVEFSGGPEWHAAVLDLNAGSDDVDTFAARNGATYWDWIAANPQQWALFDSAMAAGGRMHGLALAGAIDWGSSGSVCDVGGGTGALLATLLDLVPTLRGTVIDLEPVVGRAVEHDRLSVVAGDAFDAATIPTGHDTYLLVNVLHDWSDADAGTILVNVAAAAGASGRVLVVEGDRPAVPHDRMSASTDVLMAALTNGGRERNADEFAALGRVAGATLRASHPLASGDLAHEFVGA